MPAHWRPRVQEAFEARVQWVEEHHDDIISYATQPFADLTWTKADKPFMFLAACRAYADALQGLPVHLPVAFDGSCSGLQHLCAMSRDPIGSMVNLTPGEAPQDIYMVVAKATAELVKVARDPLGREWHKVGIVRKTVKQPTMTLAYGVTDRGMRDQVIENVIDKSTDNPFGEDWMEHMEAATYLVKAIKQSINTVVKRPTLAMKFLQGLGRATANAGKPMCWSTPLGFPVILHARKTKETRMKLATDNKGIRGMFRPLVSEYTNELSPAKAANKAAPGFVHSMDAAPWP